MYYFSFIGSASYRITGNTITMLCRANKGKIFYIKEYINKTNCAQNISSNLSACSLSTCDLVEHIYSSYPASMVGGWYPAGNVNYLGWQACHQRVTGRS